MGLGPKVGLLAAAVTALVLALAVLPGRKGDGATDPFEAYHAAGSSTAMGLGSGLGGVAAPATPTASGKSPGLAAVETLAAGLENDLKEAGLGGDLRSSVLGSLALLKDVGGGRSIQKAVDTQLDAVTEAMKKAANDADRMRTLREQKDRYTRIAQLFENASPAAAPTAAAGAALPLPASAPGYRPIAVWWRDPTGKVVAQSDKNEGFPAPAGDARGGAWYAATVATVPATVFVGDVVNAARQRTGQVFVAFQDPPAPSDGGGGNKLGLLMLVLGPLLVGGLSYVVASGHGKPIKDLARELDRLGSSGDPSRRIAAHGPEANAIARSVERMVSNLKFREQHEMGDLAEVTAKVQGTAAEIHHGLMPKNPPRIGGWEVETLFKPGFEIGGDHFDYFHIDDTHLGVIIMDTSVRGIPAAIVMSMARAYVRSNAPGLLSPGELLMRVNRLLAADLSQGQYVTALYAVIDTGNGTAKVASAGHLPLVIYRHGIGKTAIVNPEGLALGLDVGPVFDRSVTEVEVDIGVGDRLVLHTDGALKVQNETGDEYGEARLYDVIKQKAPMNSQAFVNFVGSAIDLFHTATPQNDDITISTVKRLR
jgi:serine phosphatase RsbU (regulator of sigma subunit)